MKITKNFLKQIIMQEMKEGIRPPEYQDEPGEPFFKPGADYDPSKDQPSEPAVKSDIKTIKKDMFDLKAAMKRIEDALEAIKNK